MSTRRTPSPLEEVLKYENQFVVERFSVDHSVDLPTALGFFEEAKKLLWLMACHHCEMAAGRPNLPETIRVYESMELLDQMWHTFILFTPDYEAFCTRYLGGFVHHFPATSAERLPPKAIANDKEAIDDLHLAEVRLQCRYIVEKLGVETLQRWFE